MSILVAFLIFGFIVVIHELGHFIFARINGIFVEEFALGMGPKIFGKKIGETVYSVRVLPFGGFCKMLGEDATVDDEKSFSSKSVWAKISVVIAGPLFNILLAFIFAIIMVVLRGGAETTIIDEVSQDSPAALAGLERGDQIKEINGRTVIAYREIPIYINERKGEAIELTYERGNDEETVTIKPYLDEEYGSYKIGFIPGSVDSKNVIRVIKYAGIEAAFWVKMTYYGLSMLVSGGVSVNDIAGPVGIVTVVSEGYKESAKIGIKSVINTMSFFIILLSANLGVMNLLPIPALDGGRLVFLLIEAVRGKPMNQEKEGMIHFVGYVLLMVLMVVILFNDVRKIF